MFSKHHFISQNWLCLFNSLFYFEFAIFAWFQTRLTFLHKIDLFLLSSLLNDFQIHFKFIFCFFFRVASNIHILIFKTLIHYHSIIFFIFIFVVTRTNIFVSIFQFIFIKLIFSISLLSQQILWFWFFKSYFIVIKFVFKLTFFWFCVH